MTRSPDHDPLDPSSPAGGDSGVPESDHDAGDAELRARVERALDLTRELLTPEELEEHRRMLLSLARTHPKRLEDQRPRAVPDESGTVRKKDDATLALVAQQARVRGRR